MPAPLDAQALFDRQYRMAQIVYFSFLSAIMIYAVIVETVLGAGARMAQVPAVFRMALYVFSGSCAAAVWIAPRVFLKKVQPAGLPKLAQALLVYQLFVLAMAETPAILGLVLALQSGQRTDFYLMAAWTAVLSVAAFPRKNFWQTVASTARAGE